MDITKNVSSLEVDLCTEVQYASKKVSVSNSSYLVLL